MTNVSNNNAQQEYYLTDCIELAVKNKQKVEAIICNDENEILGVNNKLHLAQVERLLQSSIAEQLMINGVTLTDPARIDVRGTITNRPRC